MAALGTGKTQCEGVAVRRRREETPQMPELPANSARVIAPPTMCAAHGCPLAGTWSNEIYPSNPRVDNRRWWGFVHAHLTGHDYQDITREVRKQMPLLEIYARAHRECDDDTFWETRRAILRAVEAALRKREPGSDDE